MVGLLRAMADEHRSSELHALTFDDPAIDTRTDGIPWRERLATVISAVEPVQAQKALKREVLPAMNDVAERLQQQGAIVTVTVKGIKTELPEVANVADAAAAVAAAKANAHAVAAAADALQTPAETAAEQTLADRFPAPVKPDSAEADDAQSALLAVGEGADRFTYRVRIDLAPSPAFAGHMVRRADLTARLEVSVAGRKSTYDVMGLNRDQIRLDIIDAYERHLNFLTMRHTEA